MNDEVKNSILVRCFGPSILDYWRIATLVIARMSAQSYTFMDANNFDRVIEARNVPLANQIYWREILYRAHVACISSLRRHIQWIRITTHAFEAANFPGFCASLRGLLESTADSADVLTRMPVNLARSNAKIRNCIEGKSAAILVSSDMENLLIHFSHARKEKKGNVPDAHIAKTSADYLKVITEGARLSKAKDLYRELCEVTHPSAVSVQYMLDNETNLDGNIVTRWANNGDERAIGALLTNFQSTIADVATLSFEPPLLTLKTLHRFELFPRIQELKKFPFRFEQFSKKADKLLKQ